MCCSIVYDRAPSFGWLQTFFPYSKSVCTGSLLSPTKLTDKYLATDSVERDRKTASCTLYPTTSGTVRGGICNCQIFARIYMIFVRIFIQKLGFSRTFSRIFTETAIINVWNLFLLNICKYFYNVRTNTCSKSKFSFKYSHKFLRKPKEY